MEKQYCFKRIYQFARDVPLGKAIQFGRIIKENLAEILKGIRFKIYFFTKLILRISVNLEIISLSVIKITAPLFRLTVFSTLGVFTKSESGKSWKKSEILTLKILASLGIYSDFTSFFFFFFLIYVR